ncbi:MAG TPA: hypothetical protein GXZ90_04450 [Clostridiales bacterium]|nr:hypothetical protein [Clostridiales bacterium]
MKLPQLPQLDLDKERDLDKKSSKIDKKFDQNKQKKAKILRPKIPKSQYDAEGNPILTVPDLNDIELNNEIDKYFGIYEED